LTKTVNSNFSKWQVAAGFEARIREAFDGATLAEIAEKIGENYHTVRNWVKSKRDPPPQFFIAVAELTNCSLYWLLTAKGPKFTSPSRQVKKSLVRPVETKLSTEMRDEIRKEVIDVLRTLLSDRDRAFVDSLVMQLSKQISGELAK